MKLTLKKYNLQPDVMQLCLEGVRLMEHSKDPHHGIKHLNALFKELHMFLRREKKADLDSINYNVLLPAICWHDVWRAERVQTKNLLTVIYETVYEGFGSARLFWRYAQNLKIDQELLYQIAHAVRTHPFPSKIFKKKETDLPLIGKRTLEAKILFDLDQLDQWSIHRLENLKQVYLRDIRNFDPRYIALGKWYFDHIMKGSIGSTFYFRSSKQEFKVRRKIIFREVSRLWFRKEKFMKRWEEYRKSLIEKGGATTE